MMKIFNALLSIAASICTIILWVVVIAASVGFATIDIQWNF